jgi:hypothetical protein
LVFAQAGKAKGPIPVRGTVNGADFIQTLIKYQGAWRLYINGQMLKDSGSKVGDTARFEIEFDPRPRDVSMPSHLKQHWVVTRKRRRHSGRFRLLVRKRSSVM